MQITPTYSGCPAMETIRTDLIDALTVGRLPARSDVEFVLSPAWTTDWLTDEARAKLTAYGIAPPAPRGDGDPVPLALSVRCPQCGSPDTRESSRFGSTSCKSLWVCQTLPRAVRPLQDPLKAAPTPWPSTRCSTRCASRRSTS